MCVFNAWIAQIGGDGLLDSLVRDDPLEIISPPLLFSGCASAVVFCNGGGESPGLNGISLDAVF